MCSGISLEMLFINTQLHFSNSPILQYYTVAPYPCISTSAQLCCLNARFRAMMEQRDAKSHEAEIVRTRMEQSTHHQQLTQLQALKDSISK